MANARRLHQPHPLVAQLRDAREKAGLSRPRFAARAGFSVSTLEQWEWGDRTPTLAAITRYADAVGMALVLAPAEEGVEQ